MASMQHDFIHPRQLDDVKAIKAAIKGFTTHMKHMMLLMKDLGTTLEQVSHAFDALTSLSFSDDGVKHYVHHFSEEVLHMMEGTAFQNYNKLVHEEVLVPVEQLRTTLKETEKAASTEKSQFDRYKKAKRKVDSQEKSYAAKSKSLDTSKSYPTNVQTRDVSLQKLQSSKADFENKFVGLVQEVEKVAATTLKRYLDLNAGYMTSVIDALTSTDPTVEEAVGLYREAQWQQRQSAIHQRCAEVDTEFNGSYASQGYRLDPTMTHRGGDGESSKGARGAAAAVSVGPQTTPAARRQALSNSSMSSSGAAKEKGSPKGPASPKGPPPAVAAAAKASPTVAASSPAKPPVVQRGAFTVTTTTANHVTPAPTAAPPQHTVSGDVDDEEDFGSVSQVGTAGRVAPPLYNFSRGPLSQVSSVRPQSGYVAKENTNLTNDFLRRMESKSLTASEVCAARAPQS